MNLNEVETHPWPSTMPDHDRVQEVPLPKHLGGEPLLFHRADVCHAWVSDRKALCLCGPAHVHMQLPGCMSQSMDYPEWS